MKNTLRINFKAGLMIFLMSVMTLTLSAQGDVYGEEYDGSDRLVVERVNGQKITLFWNATRRLGESLGWTELISEFHSDFRKVYDDIPEFDFYSIEYVQNKKLVVDEVKGKETYTLSGQDEIKYTKSNLCKLIKDKVKIFIEFNDKSELLDSTIVEDIKNAANKIKYKFYFSSVSAENHYYSVSKGEMIKGPKPSVSLAFPQSFRGGILKDQLYMEYTLGAGILVGSNKVISFNANALLKYNDETNSAESDVYLGLGFSSFTEGIDAGLEIAYKVTNRIESYEDLNFRYRFTIKLENGISFGPEFFPRSNQTTLHGFNIGYNLSF